MLPWPFLTSAPKTLDRDSFRCVVTGVFDDDMRMLLREVGDDEELASIRDESFCPPEGVMATHCTHIILKSISAIKNDEKV